MAISSLYDMPFTNKTVEARLAQHDSSLSEVLDEASLGFPSRSSGCYSVFSG
jgi:hypothetical protein